MQNFIENLGWKKLAVVMIILSILVIIFVVYSILQTPNPHDTVEKSINFVSNTPIPSGAAQNGWQTFTGKGFTLQYPQKYKVNIGQLPGGGASISFADSVSQVLLETYDASKTDFSSVANQTLGNLTSRQVSINGVNATFYTGTIELPNGSAQQRIYLFENGNMIYKILFLYVASQQNLLLEATFNRMVESIKFQ